jgi:hypothetical protein
MKLKSFQHLDLLNITQLNEQGVSIIEVLKVGKVLDRNLEITDNMLSDFVANFEAGVYGAEVQVNLGHNREGEAAGWIKKLIKEGDKLLAEVAWTPLGVEKIKSKQYKFTSSELSLSYPHFETGKQVKNVFIGVALTNVPAIKGLQAVSLSEDLQDLQLFFNKDSMKLKKFYDGLMAKDSVSDEDVKQFDEMAKSAEEGDDVAGMKKALVAKKTKKLSEADGEAEKKAAEDKKAAEEAEKQEKLSNNSKENMVQLKEIQAENILLREKMETMELNEKFESELKLSQENGHGFKPEQKDAVVKFMLKLSSELRTEFLSLVKEVKIVDLSEGGTKVKTKTVELSSEDKLLSEATTKAKELAKTDTSKTEAEHLSDLIAASDELANK